MSVENQSTGKKELQNPIKSTKLCADDIGLNIEHRKDNRERSARKKERQKTREHETREKSLNIKKIKRISWKLCVQTKGAKPFLMLDEEHLCGFSWMGFHIKPCVYVPLMSVLMLNSYLL